MGEQSGSSALNALMATAKIAPLAAAILAPVATLYSIPPATQSWYELDGEALPDPSGCKALAYVSMGLSFAASISLAGRFTKLQKRWRELTFISTIAWCVTTVLQIANLAVFGGKASRGTGYGMQEGFWCGVWSVVLAGGCALFLLFHYSMEIGRPPTDDLQVRLTGGRFMRSLMMLMSVVALEALIFSKVEGWLFWDGVYFAVVSMETIGFGDLSPTKTATKVLLFPFAIITVALLANQVTMIVSFISSLVDVRRQQWRARYAKRAEHRFGEDGNRPVGLKEEVDFLSKVYQREERMSQYFDLIGSLVPFLGFWLIGAVIYSTFEGWSYGNSVYFSYVFFLTFGYGDFSPKSAGGRAFFVLHSLSGVPILSFALGVITNIVSSIADDGYDGETLKQEHGEQVTKPHADMVEEQQQEIDQELGGTDDASVYSEHGTRRPPSLRRAVHDKESAEKLLLDELISAGCSLEAQARRLLMNQMEDGSPVQTILRADRNQQLRDMRSLNLPEKEMQQIMSEEGDGDSDLLQQATEYRSTFASFLAAASRLQQLHGRSQHAFERRREVGSRGDGNTDLSGYIDAQEKAQGAGGRSDNQKSSEAEQEARDDQESGKAGPASGIEKAMNVSKA